MFDSLEALCDEFGISKGLSKAKIRTELKKRIASIHSDKTGGEFPNESTKHLCIRMQEALKCLEALTKSSASKSSALQMVEKADGQLAFRVEALELAFQSRNPPPEEVAQRARKIASKQYRTGWLSSAIFGSICAAILPFAENISKISLFSPFADAIWLRTALAFAFAISGAAFVTLRIKELRLKRKVSAVLSEDGLTWAVRQCIHDYKSDSPDCQITQRKLTDVISKCGVRWHRAKLIRWVLSATGTRITRDVADAIARTHIGVLIGRGVITRVGNRGVEPLYLIDVELAKEVLDDHGAIVFDLELR